jgi:hypothetical protein
MAYPTLQITANSKASSDDGRIHVRATNGALKVREMFTAIKRTFNVEHYLTVADKQTLDSFYSTDKNNDVSFKWVDGVTYTVRFIGPPQYFDQVGGWYRANVTLGEV